MSRYEFSTISSVIQIGRKQEGRMNLGVEGSILILSLDGRLITQIPECGVIHEQS